MQPKNDFSPELLSELVSYDPDTGSFKWKRRDRRHFKSDRAYSSWHARYLDMPAFNISGGNGYMYGNVLGRGMLAHRAAWVLSHKKWPDHFIDHINGNRSDNRLSNLRDVTTAMNNRNVRPKINGQSQYLGVFPGNSARKSWTSGISVGGKKVHLGTFENEECAARAYDVAALYMFGQAATLNFPPPSPLVRAWLDPNNDIDF